jgi:hypothetical protein
VLSIKAMLLPRMAAARIHRPDCGGQGESAVEERMAASSQGERMQGYGCGREVEGSGNVEDFRMRSLVPPISGGNARRSTDIFPLSEANPRLARRLRTRDHFVGS